jgi:hypothetical protein
MTFIKQLQDLDYSPIKYLNDAKRQAKKAGYDPADLTFSTRPAYKLMMTDNNGKKRHFGRVGYGDFLIYKHLEKLKEVPRGYANEKRTVFHASHNKIKGKWRDDPYSPNMLALKINW